MEGRVVVRTIARLADECSERAWMGEVTVGVPSLALYPFNARGRQLPQIASYLRTSMSAVSMSSHRPMAAGAGMSSGNHGCGGPAMGETICRCAPSGARVATWRPAMLPAAVRSSQNVLPIRRAFDGRGPEGMVRHDGDDSEVAIFVIPMVVRCGARTVSWRGP